MPFETLSALWDGFNSKVGWVSDTFGPVGLWVLAVPLILLLIRLLLLLRQRKPRYQPQVYLFTKTEWRFSTVLQEAIRDDYLLMGKVRIADLLKVESHKDIKRSAWMGKFARISSKHIDFVLVCPQSGRICCCLELDDASHQRKDRIERDVFVNGAFKEAGVPLLRIPTEKVYDSEKLRKQIREAVR